MGSKSKKVLVQGGMILQTIIASNLDSNKFVLMASLDISAAFDKVNTKLLVNWLRIVGLLEDVVILVQVWLLDRSCFVTVDGVSLYAVD